MIGAPRDYKPALFARIGAPTGVCKQTVSDSWKGGGLDIVDGNPGRVTMPSRDAALPAKPAGSARACLARTDINLVQLMNNAG